MDGNARPGGRTVPARAGAPGYRDDAPVRHRRSLRHLLPRRRHRSRGRSAGHHGCRGDPRRRHDHTGPYVVPRDGSRARRRRTAGRRRTCQRVPARHRGRKFLVEPPGQPDHRRRRPLLRRPAVGARLHPECEPGHGDPLPRWSQHPRGGGRLLGRHRQCDDCRRRPRAPRSDQRVRVRQGRPPRRCPGTGQRDRVAVGRRAGELAGRERHRARSRRDLPRRSSCPGRRLHRLGAVLHGRVPDLVGQRHRHVRRGPRHPPGRGWADDSAGPGPPAPARHPGWSDRRDHPTRRRAGARRERQRHPRPMDRLPGRVVPQLLLLHISAPGPTQVVR